MSKVQKNVLTNGNNGNGNIATVSTVPTLAVVAGVGGKTGLQRLASKDVKQTSPVFTGADDNSAWTLIGLKDCICFGSYSTDRQQLEDDAKAGEPMLMAHFAHLLARQVATYELLIGCLPLACISPEPHRKGFLDAIMPRVRDAIVSKPTESKAALGGQAGTWWDYIRTL